MQAHAAPPEPAAGAWVESTGDLCPSAVRRAPVIDTHTHVTSCSDDPADVLARARAAGVQRVITIGSSPREMAAAAAVVEADDEVFTTAGLHPHSAAEWSEDVADEIRRRAAHPRCVAIGETGLDWFGIARRARRNWWRSAASSRWHVSWACRS